MYNFLDGSLDSSSANAPTGSSPSTVPAMAKYTRNLSGKDSASNNTIVGIMNGVIKEKLKIIPKDLE
jgi:serine carboxypeptidase 1